MTDEYYLQQAKDLGAVSMNLFVSTRGTPGFVISIRSLKISTKTPVPSIEKS